MSDAALSIDQVRAALEQEALRLLNANSAGWVLPLFSQHLEVAPAPVSAAYLHERIAEVLESSPQITGSTSPAEYCRHWVREHWLERSYTDDRRVQYRLSYSSLRALRIIRDVRSEQVTVSGSRLSSIGDAIKRLADITNPDVSAQLERIDEQIVALQEQRRKVQEGHERAATAEEMRLQFEEVAHLIGSLPAEFRRLSAKVEQQHRLVAAAMNSQTITKGAMVEQYLHEHDLLSRTPEGRAYRGFTDLLQSAQGETISRDIDQILAQDFARTQLAETERRQLRTLMEDLLAEDLVVTRSYTRWMASLRRFVTRSSGGRHHRLLSAIHDALDAGLLSVQAGPHRKTLPDVLRVGSLNVQDVSQLQLWHPRSDQPVEAVESVKTESLNENDREEMLALAGTSTKAVVATVNTALAGADPAGVTGAEVFAAMESQHRRLVVLLTLLDLGLVYGTVQIDRPQVVSLTTVTGVRRRVRVPRVVFTGPLPVAGRERSGS